MRHRCVIGACHSQVWGVCSLSLTSMSEVRAEIAMGKAISHRCDHPTYMTHLWGESSIDASSPGDTGRGHIYGSTTPPSVRRDETIPDERQRATDPLEAVKPVRRTPRVIAPLIRSTP